MRSAGAFDFKEAVDEGRLSYFLMNSLKLKESASVLGKMILQDLMGFIGERYARIDPETRIGRLRSLLTSLRALRCLNLLSSWTARAGQVSGLSLPTNHGRTLEPSVRSFRSESRQFQYGAREWPEIFRGRGTLCWDARHADDRKETRQVEQGSVGENSTGMKSIREVEEYVLHPNLLKQLDQGEVFAIARTVDPR